MTDPRQKAVEHAEKGERMIGKGTPESIQARALLSIAFSLLSPPSPGDPEPPAEVRNCRGSWLAVEESVGDYGVCRECGETVRLTHPLGDKIAAQHPAASPSSGGDSPEVCGEVYPGSVEVRLCKQPRGHDGPHWLAERPPPEGEGRPIDYLVPSVHEGTDSLRDAVVEAAVAWRSWVRVAASSAPEHLALVAAVDALRASGETPRCEGSGTQKWVHAFADFEATWADCNVCDQRVRLTSDGLAPHTTAGEPLTGGPLSDLPAAQDPLFREGPESCDSGYCWT